MDALRTNPLIPKYPAPPDPVISVESEMQTSPPVDPPSNFETSVGLAQPETEAVPLPPPEPHAAEESSSDMSLASTTDSAARISDLADGCSFISDDEDEEPTKQPQVNSIEVNDGLSTISNSPSNSPPLQSPPLSNSELQNRPASNASPEGPLPPPPPPPILPPSTTTSSIPSLMSLSNLDYDMPPRRDIRQQIIITPERPPAPAPPPTDYAEADSSSTIPAQQPFFFQAPPLKSKRTISNPNLNSLNDPVYPVLNPVYSAGVQVFPGLHQGVSGYPSEKPSTGEMPLSQQSCFYGAGPSTVGEVSSSTNFIPYQGDSRLSDMPGFSQYDNSLPPPLRVESPVHGHLPQDFAAAESSSIMEPPQNFLPARPLGESDRLIRPHQTNSEEWAEYFLLDGRPLDNDDIGKKTPSK
ncbi:unnamed protein product [Strongylus vulgaris]|uniref:Uncharacterized protein n=1 Tax=Strongylus vulgaris TaxID=40348 RepID=A0A3P7K261_STRVU|nr:unnamed protein product [Strongylus vulgaris]